MEKSFGGNEIGEFGSKNMSTYFRKKSNIMKSAPFSLKANGFDSHFSDVLCQASTDAR